MIYSHYDVISTMCGTSYIKKKKEYDTHYIFFLSIYPGNIIR